MLYFSLFCEPNKECATYLTKETVAVRSKNVFEVMMQSARANGNSELPTLIKNVTSKKDIPWNDVLKKVTQTCVFSKTEGPVCKTFITQLIERLWYIDGHVKSIERESSRKIPEIFIKFTGYNRPELSKHKKQTISNLSESKLCALSISLKDVIHCMKFIDNYKPWCTLRVNILKLAQVIEDYTTYLRAKNQSVEYIQLTLRSEEEKRCNVTVLPVCKEYLCYELVQADMKLQVSEFYYPIVISEHLRPGIDRKKLYYILDGFILKKGFTQKAVHYVYHVGGPKPPMHFAWKIPNDETETDLINRDLSEISEIRK